MTSTLAARLIWAALLVAGYGVVFWSVVTRQPANESGLVPGVVLGFMLVTGGWLGAGLVSAIAGRHWRRTLGFLGAFAMVTGGTTMLVWWQPQWVYELAYEPRRALVVLVIFSVSLIPGMAVVWLVVAAFAWIADRTPLLRRVRWSEELRREGTSPFWSPPSKR